MFHLVSTSISVNFWKFSVLNIEISARISSHLALENRWILCGIFLSYLGESVQSTTTASWSEYPGIMLTLLTIPGMLVINKSSTLDPRVHWDTIWLRENSARKSRKLSWRALRPLVPLTQWFSQSMSGKFRSPPIMTTLLANLPTFSSFLSPPTLGSISSPPPFAPLHPVETLPDFSNPTPKLFTQSLNAPWPMPTLVLLLLCPTVSNLYP